MSAVRIIIIVASLAVLSVSAFVAWLAARWTKNGGLKAFSFFLFGLAGLGFTAFLPSGSVSPKDPLIPFISYLFETACMFFLPYLACGVIERPMPRRFKALYAAFCAAFLAVKICVTFFALTQLAQTIIAAVDTGIVIAILAFMAASNGRIQSPITRRIVGRFTVATFVFIPILFYNSIGIPGLDKRFDPYLTDAAYFLMVAIIVILESGNWLEQLAAKGGVAPGKAEKATKPENGRYGKMSARQREIADMILDGKSAKEMATELGISPKTAENHTYALYRKFGAKSRIQFYEIMRGARASEELGGEEG